MALKIKLFFHWYSVPTFTMQSRDVLLGSPRSKDIVLYHHTMSKKFGLAIYRREGEAHLASSTVAKTGDVGEATFRSMVKVCVYKTLP
jgi:hypothetical protein